MIPLAPMLAVLSSVGYGLSDVLSGTVVRRHATASLALWAQVSGLVILCGGAAVRRPEVAGSGLAWGVFAGLVGGAGVLAFYSALQRGTTSVVAPVAGAGVLLPVLAGVFSGDALSWRSGLGVAAAMLGILVVAVAPNAADASDRAAQPVPGRTQPMPAYDGCVPGPRPGSDRSSIVLAAFSAVAFGLFFVLLERATERAALPQTGQAAIDLGLAVALAVQVGALMVTLGAATRHTRSCLLPGRSLLVPATLVGLIDVCADVLVTLAIDRGPLSVVGPLASLDPVVSVLFATVVLRERLRPLTAGGVLVSLVGIVLVGTG